MWTPEQKAALVVAQAALLNCEVAGMVAENQHRMNCGNSIAYGDEAFAAKFKEYEAVLGYNSVVGLFNE
jgi:hypothetical protein